MAFYRGTTEATRLLGFGKIVKKESGKVLVEYFDRPGEGGRHALWVPEKAVLKAKLSEQMRVFVVSEDHQTWRVGRVLDGGDDHVLIQMPNARPVNIPVEQVFVRWSQPLSDPSALLAAEIVETPMFADSRARFLAAVTGQRAASQGMGGLLSSLIELNAYQIDVVKRVLQDPVQRYLLADEVGLGKTIEAGILIRQYFIDEPVSARVLVIVPTALVGQWRQELTQRFSLGDYLDDVLHVVASTDVELIFEIIADVGMLVIDEAHHLTRLGADKNNVFYDALSHFTRTVPRLLLLSATPALVDETAFLRMLHLLDPVIFQLDDVEAFRTRIAGRQDVAEAVAALFPENALDLDDYLARLRNAFPNDELLSALLTTTQKVLDTFPEESDPELIATLESLRTYLTETHRLHRRILRNRRKSVPSWITPNRGGLVNWSYHAHAAESFATAAENLRLALANDERMQSPEIAISAFEAILNPWSDVSFAALEARLYGATGLLNQQMAELTAARADLLEDDSRLRRLVSGLKDLIQDHYQVIIFCGEEDLADSVFHDLEHAYPGQVVRHQPEFDEDAETPEWQRFLSDPRCKLLVCDHHAEEGLNLHGGRKAIVSYDLPISPNKIEQRLGRIDRYGAGADIKSFALICEDDSLEVAWLAVLEHGFGVFQQSIASLQYLVNAILTDMPSTWLQEGTESIGRMEKELGGSSGMVQRELTRIDQQDGLDSLASSTTPEQFDAIEESDEEWVRFAADVEEFLFHTLGFRKRPVTWSMPLVEDDSVIRVEYAYNTNRDTLITQREFLQYFLAVVDAAAPHSNSKTPQTYPYTYRRNTVLTTEAKRQGLRLLRYGEAFIEGLTRFAEADDRGRVFAMWRFRKHAALVNDSAVDLYFRFDFLVEVSTDDADKVMASVEDVAAEIGARATRRIADGFMTPKLVRIWLDDQLNQVLSVPHALAERYTNRALTLNGDRDFNLNTDRWRTLHEKKPGLVANWEGLCYRAREVAEQMLRSDAMFLETAGASLATARATHAAQEIQAEARIQYLDGSAKNAERNRLAKQVKLNRALEHGIARPRVMLDSVGAIFLSSFNPFGAAVDG